MKITKELFIESLKALEAQNEFDMKSSKALEITFPDSMGMFYDNHFIKDQLEKVLKVLMDDDTKDSWIDYYIYELDFGKQYKHNCATNADGSNINLSDASNLYDFLDEEESNKYNDEESKRNCSNCLHSEKKFNETPCDSCLGGKMYETKEICENCEYINVEWDGEPCSECNINAFFKDKIYNKFKLR